MNWDKSFDQSEEELKKITKDNTRDIPKAIRIIDNEIKTVIREIERINRVKGNIELKKELTYQLSNRLQGFYFQIDNLNKIKNLYAQERFYLQNLSSSRETDISELLSILGGMIRGKKDIDDRDFIIRVNQICYDLSINLIKKCLKTKGKSSFYLNEAIQHAIKTRESLSINSLDRSEIVAEIFKFIYPDISSERLKIKIRGAIEAILYGIAAAGIYKSLYHMYSIWDPVAMEHAYGEILKSAKKECIKKDILKDLTDITNSRKDAEHIFEILFKVTFH